MSMTKRNPLMGNAIGALDAATQYYEVIEYDANLTTTFHEASKGLFMVKDFLEKAETKIREQGLADIDGGNGLLKKCIAKARTAEAMLMAVAEASEGSRLECYTTFVKKEGKDNMVEALVKDIMANACTLARDSMIAREMEELVEELLDAMERLEKLSSSVPEEEGRHVFNNTGSKVPINYTKIHRLID